MIKGVLQKSNEPNQIREMKYYYQRGNVKSLEGLMKTKTPVRWLRGVGRGNGSFGILWTLFPGHRSCLRPP